MVLPAVDGGAVDPITAILSRDWAALGGWSLFVLLAIIIVIGAFREIWVPGSRLRRTEELLDKSVELNKSLSDQNGNLVTANQITKYFFEETAPRRNSTPVRGSSDDNGQDAGGDPA